jgi:glycogen synthase
MRLLVISNYYPPKVHGGYELLCRDVVECLRGEDVEILVLTSAESEDHASAERDPAIRRSLSLTARLPEPPGPWFPRSPLVDWRNLPISREVIRQFRPDGALVFSLRRIGLGPLEALRRAAVPTVYVLNDEHLAAHRPAPLNGTLTRRARWLLERTSQRPFTTAGQRDYIPVTISDFLADRLAALLPRPAVVVPQGIPIEQFPSKDSPGSIEDPPRLVYCGRLHPDKGVHVALESLAILNERGIRCQLTVVGSGPESYERRLRALARRAPGQVELVPWVAREAIGQLLREHDILVFPSIWEEPFGLSHLEAMASGTVVVSTDHGGCAELIVHNENALRFEAGDPVSLAEQVIRLTHDHELARRIAANGRRLVEERYDVLRYASTLLRQVRSVAVGCLSRDAVSW